MKIIRDKIPFILLGVSFITALLSYFNIYLEIYKYLGDLVGYSILTNVFFYTVYMNKKYCTSTKIAVFGLMTLNIFNIIYNAFGVNGVIYDIFIIFITLIILTVYKYKI